MASDNEYSILFSKYNIAVAKAKDLQEQLDTKMEQWKKRDAEFDISERLIRELCESILAKDQKNMDLGKTKSWSSMPLNELINKAKMAFTSYNSERTDFLRKLMDLAEDRGNQIEDLKEEILYYKTRINSGEELNSEEIKKAAEAEKKKKAANTSAMSPKAQQAQKSGKVRFEEAEQVKEDLVNGKAVAVYEEEDEDPIEGEKTESLHNKNIKDNYTAKMTPKSIRPIHTPKGIKDKRDKKNEIENAYDNDKLKDIEAKLDEKCWLILKILGTTGKSKCKELAACVMDAQNNSSKPYSERSIMASIVDMANIGILEKKNIGTPLVPRMALCNFTATGARIYKRKFGNQPILTEWDKVIAEHTTLEHGYGILQIADQIIETDIFEEVSAWNRSNPVIIKQNDNETGIKFVPDIVCRDKNNAIIYIEYELNHYNQREFNIKCNKILMATDRLNFVVPNTDVAADMVEKVIKFVQSKGNSNVLRHQMIRITTSSTIKGVDIRKDSNWMYTYKPIIDTEPKKNF